MKRLLMYQTKKNMHGSISNTRDLNLFSWDEYKAWLEEIFNNITQIDRNFIAICHQQEETESYKDGEFIRTIVLKYLPMIDGRFRRAIAGFFDEVYYTKKQMALNKTTNKKEEQFWLRTKGEKYNTRSSLIGIPEFVRPDLNELIKKYGRKDVKN